jgi:hypothetical protein
LEIIGMEETIFLDDVYKKTEKFISRVVAGEAVLVPLQFSGGDSSHIYALNETAASAWALLDGARSLASVAECITAEYEVEETEAAQEVVDLVREFLTLGALEKVV